MIDTHLRYVKKTVFPIINRLALECVVMINYAVIDVSAAGGYARAGSDVNRNNNSSIKK